MMFWFEPPTREGMRIYAVEPDRVRPVPKQSNALFRYVKRGGSGQSVIKNHDGTYTVKEEPTQDECDASLLFYLGGHRYLVDDDEAASLQAAGFTVTPQ